jgi:hypothetical protein
MIPPSPSSRTGSARLNVAETVFMLVVENRVNKFACVCVAFETLVE